MNADLAGDDGPALRRQLIEHITACWSTQALRVAVALNLPDLLHEGPVDAPSLAARCGCNSDGLHRLLRALCTLDVCQERRDGCFELTPGGALLRRSTAGGANGLRALALWWGGPMWSTWGDLAYSVRTGESVRARQTGRGDYGFMDASPALAELFHEAMRAMTQLVAGDVARQAFWSEIRTVVDVGGGHGDLVAAVLEAHPHLQATVLDRLDAQDGAQRQLRDKGLATRARFQPGDFFQAVPSGADCYLLKSILHNWRDDDCLRILGCCARAAPAGARLLLVERIRSEWPSAGPRDRALARTDLNMLIGLGGRERTLAEYAHLLRATGFDVTAVSPAQHEFDLVEARRRPDPQRVAQGLAQPG